MSNRSKRFGIMLILPVALLVIGAGVFFSFRDNTRLQKATETVHTAEAESPYREVVVPIADGDTFGDLLKNAGVDYSEVLAIADAAESVYSVTKIRVGKNIQLFFDKNTNQLEKLIYRIGTEDDLVASRTVVSRPVAEETSLDEGTPEAEYTWEVKRVPIPYEVKIETAGAVVDEILYVSALEKGIDELLVLDLANVLQWSVDFATQVRSGDDFKVVFEARYLDGTYVMPGRILAAEYNNQGELYQAFYFEEDEENKAYFDVDGNSVQKQFLKAPVAYKYITSGYTTGSRYISAFNISTGHRAIDYAAGTGTPIRAVGDGVVTFAGWNSQGYGYLTSIRHNGTYTTNYAHQSRIAVSVGQRVQQGDTIGYVGSTGLSTGPHLHYEMVKNGVKINPLTEILPPGKPIQEENRERFESRRNDLQTQLLATQPK